jgi:hypothetical protein
MLVCGDRIAADNALSLIAKDIKNTGFNPEGKQSEFVLNLSKSLFSIISVAQGPSRQNFPALMLLHTAFIAWKYKRAHYHSIYMFYQQLN